MPDDLDGRTLAEALIRAGLEVETVDQVGAEVTGPLVIGKVLAYEVEAQSNGKSIRWCQVDVGPHNDESGSRSVVCGAHNFEVGDIVVVALPGAVLPGGFAISARKTYGHVSDGMICSAEELGLGDDHAGILVLAEPDLEPGADAAPVLQLRDDVLDIAVTADRGYCLSMRGHGSRVGAGAWRWHSPIPVDRPMPVEIHRRLSGGAAVGGVPDSSSPSASPGSIRVGRAHAGLPAACSWPGCARSRWQSTSPTT